MSGRLGVDNVYVLLQVLDAEPCDAPFVLALGELRFVDPFGVAILARCEAKGVRLLDCPSFIRLWIDALRERESADRCALPQT